MNEIIRENLINIIVEQSHKTYLPTACSEISYSMSPIVKVPHRPILDFNTIMCKSRKRRWITLVFESICKQQQQQNALFISHNLAFCDLYYVKSKELFCVDESTIRWVMLLLLWNGNEWSPRENNRRSNACIVNLHYCRSVLMEE